MSYILDALKKSEEQRGQGAIPNVQTVHSSSLNYRDEKKAYWPYILVAAVIVNLAAIVYFIVDKDNISSVQDTAYDNNAEKTIAANNTQTALAEIPKKQVTTTRTEIEPEKIDIHAPATVAPIEKKSNSTNSSANITAGYNSNAVVNKRPAQVQKQTQKEIIDFYDLPDSIQQQLPAIIVSAHVYSSNPLQRSIVINNNFMEEGEYVIDNLILYEITADGAIFDYGETRFSYNVVSGWQ
ncbi:MAG: general secretion pathway protein GspB [Gammaproteobacteria bacterium]